MASAQFSHHEPVAIVGMGCRWPGGVRNPSQFWQFLKERVNGWKEFGDPRFSTEGFHHPNADRPGTVAMKGGFFTHEDARLFDHSFFGMTGLEAETLDPSQRKLLEVAFEAIEDAGETWESVSGSRTGVFVGNFCLDHWIIQSRDWDNPRPYAFTGAGTSILANRISYIFNLQGPSLTVDTACSSSMYALHLAVNAIRVGDCDSAIVASANWIAEPGVQIALDKLGALSASSRCHAFDARAEGYARGEGFAAVYLKRVSLAVSANSPIRAVIRGTAINSNGRTGGITRPSAKGQETVIREAYRNAGGLPFSETSYFECHGTGTYVGDPIEVAAVGNVFASARSSDDPLLVGSVKSNVGHGEGASALASIMKVVLSLENGAIPPLYDLQTLNPNIDFVGAGVCPVTKMTHWPEGRLRRASINSFGYGGANGHCVIDHVNNVLPGYVAPGIFEPRAQNGHTNVILNGHTPTLAQHHVINQRPKMVPSTHAKTRQHIVLPFSAHNETALRANMKALLEEAASNGISLANLAYTLSAKRSRYQQRSFQITDNSGIIQQIAGISDGKVVKASMQPCNLAFIFTGQGAQWHAMGADLFQYRVFETAINHLDSVLSSLENRPTQWSLGKTLRGECDKKLVQTAEVSQAVCTAVQIGLVDLLASWSIKPSAAAGHSSGEIAAAYASGRISAAEAIVVAFCRGQVVALNKQKGSMLAVGLSSEDVAQYLQGHETEVRIGAVNSPGSVTLSGDVPAIDIVSTALTSDGVFNRILKTGDNAYHSHHMLALGDSYVDMLSKGLEHIHALGLTGRQHQYQSIPWISSVTPSKSIPNDLDLPSYFRANLESPVQFSEAVARLMRQMESSINAVVEIGPHPALKSPLQQILDTADMGAVAYCSTLKRDEPNQISLLGLAGKLFCLNAAVDLVAVNAVDAAGDGLTHGCTVVGLPSYHYTYGQLNYHESRVSKEYRFRSVARHDLLGSKVVGNTKLRPTWRNTLRVKDVPWLADHRLVPDAVLPGAAYLLMAVEGIRQVHNEFTDVPRQIKGFSLRDVNIKRSLVIPEDDYGIEVLTSLDIPDASTDKLPLWVSFSISSVSRETNEWIEHSTGQAKIELQESGPPQLLTKTYDTGLDITKPVDAARWYKKFLAVGLGYGKTFQPLENIRMKGDEHLAMADITLSSTKDNIKGGESTYPVHPASLDGAIQLGLIASNAGRVREATMAYVPVRVDHMYISNDKTAREQPCTGIARGLKRGMRGAYLDLQMLRADGSVLVNVEKLRCVNYSSEAKEELDQGFRSPFTRLVWKPDIRAMSNPQARQKYPPPSENVARARVWGLTNELAHLIVYSIYETFGKLQDGPAPSGDVGHYFAWIKRKSQNDRSPFMVEARKLAGNGNLQGRIEEIVAEASEVLEVKIAKLLHDSMADILNERRTGVDVIIGEGLLTPLYQSGLLMTGIYPQLYHVLDDLAHADPNLRILEIGGGTGGATRIAMRAFSRGENRRIKAYRAYTFTDISPGFLSAARESMADLHDMIFSVFDTEVDPQSQGYEEGTYDLIIACQVLHATSNMSRTLSNCRRLLKPGGKLVLVETTQGFIVPGVVVGTFTGYWAGIPDGRVDAPFQSLEAWDTSLRGAGFSGLDIVLDDFPVPQNTTSVILSTAMDRRGDPLNELQPSSSAVVHVLYSSEKPPQLVHEICEEVRCRGPVAMPNHISNATQSVLPVSQVIALLSNEHLLTQTNEQCLGNFQHLVQIADALTTITSCGVAKGKNAEGALVSGLLRVLQNENPSAQYVSVDLDADNFELQGEEGREFARCIMDKRVPMSRRWTTEADMPSEDTEFVWQDGCLWVSRYVPDAGFHAKHGIGSQRNIKPKLVRLRAEDSISGSFASPGVVGSLYFQASQEHLQPLPQGFIDVQVAAVGLSWRDFDRWSGRVDANYLSLEYSGIITAVGAGAADFNVGDRVYGLGLGHLGNRTRVPAAYANRVQRGDDLVQMAAMPLASLVVTFAFDHATQLREGQTVLVLSGADETVAAAVSLGRTKGADVFVFAESSVQADFLSEQLGVQPRNIIRRSAAQSLESILKRAAESLTISGFDVVLSVVPVPNEVLQASVAVLAPLGHVVDAGRFPLADIQASMPELLRKNASYRLLDPAILLESGSISVKELLSRADQYYREGSIQPIAYTASDTSTLQQTLSDLVNVTGKLVVTFVNSTGLVKMTPSPPQMSFDPEAYYVITGGLGGLGQSLVRWMTSRGARRLALLSRRDGSAVTQAKNLVQSMAALGVQVECITCDVTSASDVTRAVESIVARSQRKIKGIVHAAVQYLDLSFVKLTSKQWNQSLSAKVQGARNLHEATLSMPLDFFVMVTSALSLYAFPTQGAYTAANNFQDAFARYRRAQGLPASAVSFSLVEDVTNVGTNDLTRNLFKRNMGVMLGESQLLALIEPAFLNNQTAGGMLDDGPATPEQWAGQSQDLLSAANLHTYLDPAALLAMEKDTEISTESRPGWHRDARASLVMRAVGDGKRESAAESTSGATQGAVKTANQLRREFETAVQAGVEGRAQTMMFVQDAIVHAVAERLFIDVEGIDGARSVADLGVDSLIAAEMRTWFLQALGKSISMLDMLDPSVSIASVARSITDEALAASKA